MIVPGFSRLMILQNKHSPMAPAILSPSRDGRACDALKIALEIDERQVRRLRDHLLDFLVLPVAELENQPTAGSDPGGRIADQPLDESQSILTAKQRDVRLVIPNFRLQCGACARDA